MSLIYDVESNRIVEYINKGSRDLTASNYFTQNIIIRNNVSNKDDAYEAFKNYIYESGKEEEHTFDIAKSEVTINPPMLFEINSTAQNMKLIYDESKNVFVKVIFAGSTEYDETHAATLYYTQQYIVSKNISGHAAVMESVKNINNDENVTIKKLFSTDDSSLISNLDGRVIVEDTIAAGEEKHYYLQVWIDSKAENEVMNQIFYSRLKIDAIQSVNTICKRAKTLHTDTCNGYGCKELGYNSDDTITYGNLGTKGSLQSGDAFDCDVNGDGVFDEQKERFYYVSDATNGITTDSSTAVLLYSSNVDKGAISNTKYVYYYDNNVSAMPINGPDVAYLELPTTSQWKNVRLTNSKRKITNEINTNTIEDGYKEIIDSFDYGDRAARLLTIQELNNACDIAELKYATKVYNCDFIYENSRFIYYNSYDGLTSGGFWLENPRSDGTYTTWYVNQANGYIDDSESNRHNEGVRPAIEVPKNKIDF